MRIVESWLNLPGSTRELLSRHRWDFASQNHDDDFHTDVLFLRVSCGSMASFAGHANRSVLSYHDGFDARFFYEEQENRGVIAHLVERYFGDRPWRESIPGAIREATARFDAVLSPLRTPEALRHLSLSELRAVYTAQHEAHLKLYEPCWTAEALQAAGKGLTEALIRLLLEKNVSRETLFEIFNTLTATDAPSIFGAEQERPWCLRRLIPVVRHPTGGNSPKSKQPRKLWKKNRHWMRHPEASMHGSRRHRAVVRAPDVEERFRLRLLLSHLAFIARKMPLNGKP